MMVVVNGPVLIKIKTDESLKEEEEKSAIAHSTAHQDPTILNDIIFCFVCRMSFFSFCLSISLS